jgi:hypothetical protein
MSTRRNVLTEIYRKHPDFSLLCEAADHAESRTVTSHDVTIYDYKADDVSTDDLLQPGTVTLILGRSGSETLGSALSLIKKKGKFDPPTIKRIRASYEKREILDLSDAVGLMRSMPTIADLIGGRFTLSSNIFVPDDLDIVLIPLPYNGGDVSAVKFKLIQRHATDVPPQTYESFLVRRAPRLTAAEAAALKLVPRDATDLNIGRAGMCYAITMVAVVAVVMGATYACPGRRPDFHLDDEDVKRLGPELTARTLIRLRRQALEQRF